MSHTPEEDLARHLKQQEGEIHGNLFMLNQLFQLCADASLSEKDLLKQAVPIVEKLSKTNPVHPVPERGSDPFSPNTTSYPNPPQPRAHSC